MSDVFKIILETSLAASLLALLTMGARLLIGRRPSAALPLLSALIIIRLMIPVTIPSQLSIMNLFGTPRIEQPSVPQISKTAAHGQVAQTSSSVPQNTVPQNETEQVLNVSEINIPAEITADDNAVHNMSALEIAAIVWIAGMAVMAGSITVSNMRFALMLRKNRRYDAPGFEELLERCKEKHKIRQHIETVQLSGINTAAVYGIFRIKLLISPLFAWLSEKEKRHVIMHELAHIKRRDMLASLLISILNILYWFNPIIWAALALARRDMEIMCDMAVFKKTQDRRAYAETLLTLAKTGISKPRFVTALLELGPQNVMRFGASVSTDSIKRRIKMISRYKKSPLFMSVAIILVMAIAVTGCTGAVAENAGNTNPESVGTPEVNNEVFTVPEIEGKELIASYSLDFSSVSDDEARVANINKAAQMLDGTLLPHMDDSLPVDEDFNRQIDIPDVLGPITTEAGWENASWTGWGLVETYVHKNDESSGYFADETTQVNARRQVGGGIEIAAMAYYRAAVLAGLDNGSDYSELWEEDNVDAGGLGATNNNYTNDLILKMWIKDSCVIAALYAEGTAEKVPRATADPNNWRKKFSDKFTGGEPVITENSYKSANINIKIEKIMKGDVPFFIADIYVANIENFKTAFAKQEDVLGDRELTSTIAEENNAILAINGDHCLDNSGLIIRNGNYYPAESRDYDILVMYRDGTMKTLSPQEFDVEQIKSESPYQVWSFGPMLLKDGKPITEFNLPADIAGSNPRTAIGYYEPGHYCFVVVGGRQQTYSQGCTMQELAQLFADRGCTAAYNLDGGKSSEMIFNGVMLNEQGGGRRSTPDILFIGE